MTDHNQCSEQFRAIELQYQRERRKGTAIAVTAVASLTLAGFGGYINNEVVKAIGAAGSVGAVVSMIVVTVQDLRSDS